MAEEIVRSNAPFQDALNWLTEGGTRQWTFKSWNTAMKYPDKIAGMSGTLAPDIAFTIRYDWDETKLYHVNATRGAVRRAYCPDQLRGVDTERQAMDRYNNLTNKIKAVGDQAAAKWFMTPA